MIANFAPERAARLLVAAARQAGTLRTLFDPDQARDESGKWTSGGTSRGDGGSVSDKPTTGALPKDKFEKVQRRARDMAARMGVSDEIITVVDKEPREFEVGGRMFKEAGHFNPATERIEINARNSYDDRMSVTNGILAHELSHAVYHAAEQEQAAEHREITDLPPDEFNRLFRSSGYVREETQKEVHERWPVSAMFYKHVGDSFMETEAEQQGGGRFREKLDELQRADGITEYSKAYWSESAMSKMNSTRLAINETLAEMARGKLVPFGSEDVVVKPVWARFSKDLLALTKNHDGVKKRLGRR